MYYILHKSQAVLRTRFLFAIFLFYLVTSVFAADQGSLRGTVKDPLGAIVVGAKVDLLNGTVVAGTTTTDSAGNYSFEIPKRGLYRVRAAAPTFQSTMSDPVYVSKTADLDLTLSTQTLTQQVSVTSTAMPTPVAQIGASVNVLTEADYQRYTQVQDPLRQIPCLQITQVGT